MASDQQMHNKPKLLVILGAGSSIPYGMPSVGDINEQMKCWSRELESGPGVKAGCDVFSVLWRAAKRYYGQNDYCIRPNYERILGEMTGLSSWLSSPPFGTPLTQAIRDSRPIRKLDWLQDYSDKHAARKRVLEQHTSLFQKLAEYMRLQSKKLDLQSCEFADYRAFFCELRKQFELGVYNLNYDTVARAAWTDAFNGFDCNGEFDPLSVSQRREWGFIYHLHGTVHHCISDTKNKPRVVWKNDLDQTFRDSGFEKIEMSQDFRSMPLTTMIAGGFKLDQVMVDPYQTLFSTLVRHVHEADSILIAGYGFGDLHVNRVLRNRFERPMHGSRSYPRVVILEKSCPQRKRTACLETHQYWSRELRHTLKTSFRDGSALPKDRNVQTITEFIEQEKFETDIQNRVSIWHGGFQEGLSVVDKIIKRLSR